MKINGEFTRKLLVGEMGWPLGKVKVMSYNLEGGSYGG
jgi:hypothetical protein